MSRIAEIDKNLKIDTKLNLDDVIFINAEEEPVKLYGVFKENGSFRRIPETLARETSEGVHYLHNLTAGGRVRFSTDSEYIAVTAKMHKIEKAPHFPMCGSSGFDLYADGDFCSSFVPPVNMTDGYEGVIRLTGKRMREININFPLYSGVKELYIGVQKDSFVKEPRPYKYEKPFVYYGSSITQGGCASTPGMSYQSIVSRRFDADFINLGFSGNARGEECMANYIKDLDMSLFVLDYDHNAPTVEHLMNTHEKFFKAVREKNPTLPIIMMSRPKYKLTDDEKKRLEVIRETYENAIKNGDKNVYLIDNVKLTELCLGQGTVDNCHPTDFGFASMAKAVCDVIEKIL